jgi:hypothetical protein
MTAATVIAAMVRTIMPRLARVTSIAAPIGVWNAIPSNPLPVVTSPTSVWLQCWSVTRKTLTNGPNRFRTSAARKLSASSAYGIGVIAANRSAARSRALVTERPRPIFVPLKRRAMPDAPHTGIFIDKALRSAR